MDKNALIAMSGGIDSTVAAYLMKQKGYNCTGITMKLFDNENIGISKSKTCCSLDDVEDAANAAIKLGFPHYVSDLKGDFIENVIERFISAYENGATPNPCIDCNRYIKFTSLYNKGKEIGCDIIATGHYAKIEKSGSRFLLKKAADDTKDQSYVLCFLTQEQLAHTAFPCGEYKKTEIRSIAHELGLYNADKPDSQDICFVPDGDHAAFMVRYTGKQYPKGDIVDKSGCILGTHNGIIRYTIGQRKGLGISSSAPLYVCKIDRLTNTITLGSNDDLFTKEFYVDDINMIAFDNPPESFKCSAKIRYRHAEQPAVVHMCGERKAKVIFETPQRAVTKGQAAVFYDGDTVIGGGIIC